VRAGHLREDLYYRLAGFVLRVPPLRDRARDVPLLAQTLLDRLAREGGARPKTFAPAALACLATYGWPGNVAELEREVARAAALAPGDVIGAELLSAAIAGAPEPPAAPPSLVDGLDGTLRERMEKLEARVILETLTRQRWNKSRAADELGLTRAGLRAKMARYGLERG
jgi:two-component system response regulator HupR/HoxA